MPLRLALRLLVTLVWCTGACSGGGGPSDSVPQSGDGQRAVDGHLPEDVTGDLRRPDVLGGLCQAGQCDDGNDCTYDRCAPATGECSYQWLSQPCDDGSLCTANDFCRDGNCVGDAVDCSDDNPCTVATCDPLTGCRHEWVLGVACDDQDPCTVNDQCFEEGCQGDAITCLTSNPCEKSVCDGQTGQCAVTPLDGPPCNDGNVCTLQDQCVVGSCVGALELVCQDGNPCTTDFCDPAKGCVALANTLPCDDGNPCTSGDVCAQGTCFAGPAKACQDSNPCTLDTCDLTTGNCLHEAVDWACDDGNACTVDDHCLAGTCIGAPAVCDDLNPCTAGTCDPALGCQFKPVGAPCSDGNPCTIGDLCQGGSCLSGPWMSNCDDGNPCTDDMCDPLSGNCLHVANIHPCEDGNLCTTGDTCQDGSCQPGDTGLCQCLSDADCGVFDDGNSCNGVIVCNQTSFPPKCAVSPGSVVECSAIFNSQCRKASCQPASGLCVLTDLPDGSPCDDENPCTTSDQCLSGQCGSPSPVDCDDGNPCTKEHCDPEAGCVYTAVSLACDDGNLCTLGDVCVGGNCIGVPITCEDGNPCTTGTCSPDTGECSYPLALGSCDDGNPCTFNDQCFDGVCLGTPTNCDDGNPCTADGCDGAQGCVHQVLEGSCDDGNACTGLDFCSGAKCKGVPLVCNDGNPCTDDLCDMNQGCLHPANVAPCNDENQCTYGDHCVQGECVGLAVSCEDGNPCTETACHEQAGCLITNLNVPCDDGSACTMGDWCTNGVCVAGPPPVCNDGNPCTLDTCDTESGKCLYLNTGWPCDDGNACTELDYCAEGMCVGFSLSCHDDNACTSDSCDPDHGCLHAIVDGGMCDDGNLCTAGDLCLAGVCLGKDPVLCNDGNPCTTDTCHPIQGCLFAGTSGGECDDDDAATISDTCADGQCVGLPDNDGDGVPDSGPLAPCQGGNTVSCHDNCLEQANPGQEDGDNDAIGDLCEFCGAAQVLDGVTPPDPDVWGVAFQDACPPLDTVAQAETKAGETLLTFSARRGAECGSDTVHVTLVNQQDLSGAHTVVELDLGLFATVYPAQFLGIPIGYVAISNGVEKVVIKALSGQQASGACGTTAVVPPAFQRALWTLTVDHSAQEVALAIDDVSQPEATASLANLAPPWRVEIGVLGGDLMGGCGAEARIDILGYETLCQW